MEAEERITVVDAMDGSSDDSSESEMELMVTSRARRATAGNRYSTLVAQEETEEDAEDEVAMLFAEGEGEDDDFNSDEGDDEADMSSSDDDDQGPNTATDDLEGEKEIQKEAKVERARKRKADLALTTTSSLRKKPKFDPTALRKAPVPKPSKRKERVSWLPGSSAAPGRTSLRKQTILHRAETHAKMKENEEQRLKMKAKREKREKEREAAAPKELTQADRLAEAERVERRNAKSLNRWEAMEKKRAEEQAARLAALKERKLEGAVVTWYSSSAKYYGLKETKEIDIEPPHEPKKRGRKPKALLEQLAAAKLASSQAAASTNSQPSQNSTSAVIQVPADSGPSTPITTDGSQSQLEPAKTQDSEKISSIEPTSERPLATNDGSQNQPEPDSAKNDTSFLTGIHEYASMQTEPKIEGDPENLSSATPKMVEEQPVKDIPQPVLSKDGTVDEEMADSQQSPASGNVVVSDKQSPVPVEKSETNQDTKAESQQPAQTNEAPIQTSTTTGAVPLPGPEEANSSDVPEKAETAATVQQQDQETNTGSSAPIEGDAVPFQPLVTPLEPDLSSPAPPPGPPPIEVISTRNLVILDKFDDLSDQARQDFTLFYNTRKTAKPVKHSQELCPVTGLPARYRDPATGLGYATAAAYKKLQEIRTHQFVWSSMLGCYVGRSGAVARGVPEGFLGK